MIERTNDRKEYDRERKKEWKLMTERDREGEKELITEIER